MQAHEKQSLENRHSSLILKEDNDQVFSLLGVRCQAIATTVIQLFITHPPHHSQWVKKDTGILCFVKDNYRKNYFFRLYCLKRNCMIWEQEVYSNMEYIKSCTFLHTFEGDECMIAFNFANVSEANEMKEIVDKKLLTKRRREDRQMKTRIAVNIQEQPARLPNMNDINAYKKPSSAAKRSAKRTRNITKADIGNPSEFRHISHVGFDPYKGFDVDMNDEDPQLKQFFEQVGISKKDLQNRRTREFVYGFVNSHGGLEAVQEELQKTRKTAPAPPSPVNGPPVPPRGTGRSTRAAPPPPPTSTSQNQRTTQPPRNLQASGAPPPPPSGIPPPPAMPPTCVAPPPPPLPPPSMEIPSYAEPHAPTQLDQRMALMENIRGGTILRPVNTDMPAQPTENSRGDLLSQIRKGFQLKPANEREIKPTSPLLEPEQGIGLVAALAKALDERKRATHSEEESTSDSDSNDDEWDM